MQGCESGSWSLRLPECWTLSTGQGVRVDVLDQDSIHGRRVTELAGKVCDEVRLVNIQRYYPETVSAAISNAVDGDARVVAMPFGIVNGSANDPRVMAALQYANLLNVVVVAAAPQSGVPDWPNMTHLLQVNHGRMDGTINYGYTAIGEHLMLVPGRNLVAQGVYYGGNSDACGIAAGCVAILRAHRPDLTAAEVVTLLRRTADDVGQTRRINLLAALQTEGSRLLNVEAE